MNPKKFFWILVGVLIVLLGSGGAAYYYAVKYLKAASTKLEQQYIAENDANAKIDQLIMLQAKYNKDVLPVITDLDAALPKDKNQTEILAQLEKLAANAGLVLSSVSFPNSSGPSAVSQAVKSGNVLALPISFQTTGTYAQLESFLSQLETLNRYTSVTNLTVAKVDSKKISFSINMNAYFKP